ncbi:MAG: M23 family metallopeptidase [Kofleriaceae bacterium]
MGALPWLVGGGALAYAATRLLDREHARSSAHGDASTKSDATKPAEVPKHDALTTLAGSWLWPVPRWNGRAPVISDGYTTPRPGGVMHGGIDLMFARSKTDTYKVGSANGTKAFVMPDQMVALAAADARVRLAKQTPRGLTIQLEHEGAIVTYYTHLAELLVKSTTNGSTGERVRAGQPIGVIGADPMDGQHIKHLHFEIWMPPGRPQDRVDPEPIVRNWPIVPIPNA